MIDIIVVRGEGSRPGEDVVDPLIATLDVALSRGRMELDEGALAEESVLECILHDSRLGNIILVDDSTLGQWRGKITGISHTVNIDDSGNMTGSTTINLRKPRA